MLRKRQELHLQAHQFVDALLFAVALYLAYCLRDELGKYLILNRLHPFSSYVWLYLIFCTLGPYLLERNGLYVEPLMTSLWRILWPIVSSVGLCVLLAIAIVFVFQRPNQDPLSRMVLVLFGGVAVGLLFFKQLVWR